MKNTEIKATYGSCQTPCTVFIEETAGGGTWYAVEGSSNINLTYDEVGDGVDIETLQDMASFSWPGGVDSHLDLVDGIEAYIHINYPQQPFTL